MGTNTVKRLVLYSLGLGVVAGLSTALLLWSLPSGAVEKSTVMALMASMGLLLTAYVAFTQHGIVTALRRTRRAPWVALSLPLVLLIPYLIFAGVTETFRWEAAGRLALYAVVPGGILLVGRREHPPARVRWQDALAMLALAVPVAAGWLSGIWTWPGKLEFSPALFAVPVGAYAFMVVRGLEGVGYRIGWRRGDWVDGLVNFAVFAMIAIPLGLAMGFLHLHAGVGGPLEFFSTFFAVYLTVAIPEEFLFRGVLQNLLSKTFRKGIHALLVASVIFGLAHFHHLPVPNWKYVLLATIAGFFYGNAFRTRKRLSAAALTHALVDTVWRFWF